MTADYRPPTFWEQSRIQIRVIWALVMREMITRFGREGLGVLWMMAEPAMFVVGVMIIFSHTESKARYSVAEYLAVSYPTLLFWRNTASRVIKAIEYNRSLLHHKPIRPIDILYSRIILEFAGATASFFLLYTVLVVIGICQLPADPLSMILGYFLVVWFSFNFVMTMAALSEMSEAVERVSHVILYLMIPFSGVFIPTYVLPPRLAELLTYFPLVDAVEYFHYGYYGDRMPTLYYLGYTVTVLLFFTLFALSIAHIAIRRVQLN
ncbi:ABC transporter permease [Burkholderia cenocepacia]|uniref:Transport permease protein n=2 Tax=Burkholderia cenocepacia TaxID=95486 RepID=A0AAW4TCI7_9BURK|nr:MULTISPECIES: ABC transporter permease [Burkholderia]AOJ20908.1 sugar ABC transporter permease [Burkholderia cenocepacia]AQQ36855.1 sugar ABC transporter permease [Burkholderia cenocepacia]AQT49284.1 sugar ABC transporter permease [Burkholderia cenocepacia]MBG0869602.1 ABC transporter permease [Burkholderia sp. 9777_1386]MBJ9924857.1 ABC transporter permease [Burkholderia cenocepacia]